MVLEGDFIDARGIEAVELFGLGRTAAESVTNGAGPIADLADVDANIGIEGAGGDCERVPLRGADGGNVDQQPLASFVLHRGLRELDFHRIVGVADDLDDLRRTSGLNLTIHSLQEVDSAANEFPAPAFVPNTVIPKGRTGERGVRLRCVSDETAGGMGVESEEEWDEEVVSVPERLV